MIREFSGSHSNIVGLPIEELKIILEKTGYGPISEA
jgi:predicted house-cleaning NTP pyrophosphatase (Maf/HAM1 superfamily)